MDVINQYLFYVDLSFLILLIIFMLRGLIVGTKKMLITSVLKWGMILLLIIFSRNIADLLLKTIKIEGVNAGDFLINFLSESMELSIQKGSYLETLIYAIIKAVVSLAIGYLAIFVVTFLIYPIISLVLMILGIRKAISSSPKTITSKLGGMGIGVLVSIVVFVTCYMPIYGTMSLATSIEKDMNLINKEETINISIDSSENTSIILKTIGDDYNICERYMDSFFVISMNGSNVRIIKEYRNFRTVIPFIAELTESGSETIITEECFNTVVDVLANTELKEIALPVTLEILYANGVFEKNNIEITEDDIYKTDWAKEIGYFDDFLLSLKDTYTLYNKYIDEPINMIGDEKFSSTFKKNIELLFKITIINKYGPEILNQALDKTKTNVDDPTTLKALELIDFQDNLLSDIEIVLNSLYNIYHLGFINKDIEVDYKAEKTATFAQNLAKDIFKLSFVKGKEEKIIEVIYDILELNQYAEFSSIDLTNINWDTEPEKIATIVIEFAKILDGENINDADIMKIFSENNESLINAIASSEIIRYGLLPGLNGMIKEKIKESEYSELSDLINIPTDEEKLKNDLTVFTKIIPLFEEEDTNILDDEEKLKSLITDLLSLSFIKGNEKELFEKLINNFGLKDFIDNYGLTLDYNVENWEEEGKTLASLAYQANKLGMENLNNFDELITTKKDEVKELLITITNSTLLQKSLPTLIDKTLTDMQLENWKSEWLENEQTTFHKNEWLEEINNLIETLEMYLDYNLSFDNFDKISASDVSKIKNILDKMTDLRSIKLNYFIEIINEKLNAETGTTTTYLVVPSDMNWKQEINSLFGEDGVYTDILNLNNDTTYREYGKILDKLKNLQTINDDSYYTFIADYIQNLDDYKNNKITISIDKETLKKVTSFEEELAIIDEIDFTQETQSGEIIDKLMTSVLLRTQTETYIKDIIKKNDLDSYYDVDNNLSADIDLVNQKIKATKEDEDPTNDWSWSKEIEIIENFKTKLDETISSPTEENANELKEIAGKGIITSKALEKVLEKYPVLKMWIS